MLIIILPCLGFILSFFARFIGKKPAIILSIGSIILTFFYVLYLSLFVLLDAQVLLYTIPWIILQNLQLNFVILLDSLSIQMSLLITLITSLVMLYSYAYLENDPSLVRFLAFFSLFALCMLIMVTSGNYIQLFLGWEGVGLTSYLLISFWHTRNAANQGALKAVIVNRIGDCFFMFALALMWVMFKSWDFSIIFNIYPEVLYQKQYYILNIPVSVNNLLGFCLLVAACAKSAQLLLHTWLPDAMEGPTPVSSLLHSATMVTAGIFLIIRSSFIFAITPAITYILCILGVLTALISGLIGLNQFDLKRVIAYSTCSQLGFMMLACGLGYYSYAFFHLITHAFFKCLLFLCSGAIIHALNDEQDIRKMGNLFHFLPVTFSCMLIGSLALMGFPFLSGFYSKDLILETAYVSGPSGAIIFFFAAVAAFLTSFYSIRSLYLVFFRSYTPVIKPIFPRILEAPFFMLLPMIILAIFALGAGFMFQSAIIGPINIWNNAISFPILSALCEHEYIPLFIKLVPTGFSLFGLILGYLFFSTSFYYKFNLNFYSLINLTSQKFYFDQIYNVFITKTALTFGYIQYIIIDRGFLELFGPYGITLFVFRMRKLSMFHNGFISHYIFFIFLAILLFFCYSIFFNCSFVSAFIIIISFFLGCSIRPVEQKKEITETY